jgi:hypothetical protein
MSRAVVAVVLFGTSLLNLALGAMTSNWLFALAPLGGLQITVVLIAVIVAAIASVILSWRMYRSKQYATAVLIGLAPPLVWLLYIQKFSGGPVFIGVGRS